MPYQEGKPSMINTFVDVDHAHDLETKISITVVIMFHNKAPIKLYRREHNTKETSTYSLDMVAIRITT